MNALVRVARPRRLLVAALAVAAFVPGAPASAATDRLPDLGMARLDDFYVQRTSSGQRRLRFTSVIVNVGEGTFRVRGSRRYYQSTMTTKQRIYFKEGGYREFSTPAVMKYSGDGHNHWHVQKLQSTVLYPLDAAGQPVEPGVAGSKQGFCFYDNVKYRLSLPGAPRSPVYTGCGSRSSTSVTMGLSVGWGDEYPWDIAYQYVYVTGLPSGKYRLVVTADPSNWFLESNDTNNATWVDLQLSSSSSSVTVLGYGPAA